RRARARRAPPPPAVVRRFERDVREDALRAYGHHRGARRRLEGALAADLELYLGHVLNRQDKCTMASSVETRVPFLDPDVIGLALNLPLEARLEPTRKGVLRDVVRRRFGPELAGRPKLGFGFDAPALIAAAADERFLLHGRLREVLDTPADAWAEGVRTMPPAWRLPVWTAEMWCRLMLDGQPREEVEAALWAPTRAGAPAPRRAAPRAAPRSPPPGPRA
ncbi:MAG TPA: asparagine synthase-related protein, partial [Solirubrobacteraceae bacterium]|nr:asparagine synthase-related protein [Solirubrobacteraceae bacterium]